MLELSTATLQDYNSYIYKNDNARSGRKSYEDTGREIQREEEGRKKVAGAVVVKVLIRSHICYCPETNRVAHISKEDVSEYDSKLFLFGKDCILVFVLGNTK